MTKIYGSQSQKFDGIVDAISRSKPPVWKLIDPDSDILRNIKSVSPSTTTVVRIYTGQAEVADKNRHPNAEQYGKEYAELVYSRVKDPANCDYIESENEPVDNYNDLTEFIKRLNAFTVGFSNRAKQLGFKPLVLNFSTGYPEVYIPGTDYELWPNAWQGLVDGLRTAKSVGGALGIHEYDAPDLFRLWSDSKHLGYLTGRHKAIYKCFPQDLQNLPLYLTEFEVDWLVYGIEGGFWHNRDENAPYWMCDQMREAWDRIYKTSPQLKGICFFLWGRNDPRWEEYDQKRTDTSAEIFTNFFKEELSNGTTPVPPIGDITMERLEAAWNSVGVDFNPTTAFYKKAQTLGLGKPEGDEFPYTTSTGEKRILQGYNLAYVDTKVGEYNQDQIKAYDWLTGKEYVPSTNPSPNPPLPYDCPDVLALIGAYCEETQPIVGKKFYRLAGATVRTGVSAFCVVTVIGKNGIPVIGARVVNQWRGSTNGEVILTDASGVARFQFGASSAFTTPGQGPFSFAISLDATKDFDTIPPTLKIGTILSDWARSIGDFQGQHTEISLQFVEQ